MMYDDEHSARTGEYEAADSLRNIPLPAEAELAQRRTQDPSYQPPCCADHEPKPFSTLEMEFFKQGDEMSEHPSAADSFSDLEVVDDC